MQINDIFENMPEHMPDVTQMANFNLYSLGKMHIKWEKYNVKAILKKW